MVTVAAIGSSTREKLERARTASAQLAQFSTEEKNRLLLLMADAIEAHAGEILRANEQDIAESKLCRGDARSPAAQSPPRPRNGGRGARRGCAS